MQLPKLLLPVLNVTVYTANEPIITLFYMGHLLRVFMCLVKGQQ